MKKRLLLAATVLIPMSFPAQSQTTNYLACKIQADRFYYGCLKGGRDDQECTVAANAIFRECAKGGGL